MITGTPFEYRVVEVPEGFMPQRGVSGHIDGISKRTYWRDAVPVPAPTRELADSYVASLQKFDAVESQGRVVWQSE